MRTATSLLTAVVLVAAGAAQNSTVKHRPEPSALAARAGTQIQWRDDVDDALAEARQRGLPVLWYVPTVAGSPMDRRPEIDRYMMAGPWSDPDVVALVDAGFVPVKAVATGARARALGLVPRQFIEPGFVVLSADAKPELVRQHLITLIPKWFVQTLQPLAGEVPKSRPRPDVLQRGWQLLAAAPSRLAKPALDVDALLADEDGLSDADRAELAFVRGALHWTLGARDRARAQWQRIGAELPDQPWSWKCAAEAEGHGPFVHGFEVFASCPLTTGLTTTRAAPDTYGEADLRKRGLRFFAAMQRADGAFDDSRYDFGGTDSLPNVFAAVTALVGWALQTEPPGEGDDAALREAVLAGVRRHALAEDMLAESDRDELLWAHVYRCRFLAAWLAGHPDDADARAALRRSAQAIVALQPQDGAWFHEYPNPFATASALLALADARDAGVEVPEHAIAFGVRSLLRCRADDGAFTYYQVNGGSAHADLVGAAGRMPLCELALLRWGKADQARLRAAVAAALQHHEVMAAVRNYDDHADPHGYGGFFFWFDMVGRTEAILALTDAETRARAIARQRELVLGLPELDGCFVDSHELGRVYGTASALCCLALLDR